MATFTSESEVTELSEPNLSDYPRAGRWPSDHSVDFRLSVPLPPSRWYMTILAGMERRGVERRTEERHKHPLVTNANMIFLLVVGFVAGGGLWLIVKSLLF